MLFIPRMEVENLDKVNALNFFVNFPVFFFFTQGSRGGPVSLFVNTDAFRHVICCAALQHPSLYQRKLWRFSRNNWPRPTLRRRARSPRNTLRKDKFVKRNARKLAYLRASLGAVSLLKNTKLNRDSRVVDRRREVIGLLNLYREGF